MFPKTNHVETVCLLSREKVDGYVELSLDTEMLQGKHGSATYGEIKAYVEEQFGLKVSSLYISQIKTEYGLIERECYNHGSGEGRVPKCPEEKKKAIIKAFEHFNMI